jgi:ribonuclease R
VVSRPLLVDGKIQHKGRFAFVVSELPGSPDVFVKGPTLRLARDGDRVRVKVFEERGGRRSGEIVSVLERGKSVEVGLLLRAGKFWALLPEGAEESEAVHVLGFAKGVEPRQGVLASLRIERRPTLERVAGGTVTAILGSPNDPKVRRAVVLASRDIPTEFPEDALEAAAALPQDPAPSDWEGRPELFDLPVFTIDGADAKDFDDAVSLEELDGGRWRLGVHIADVAHYVKPGQALDKEAVRRGTSVYLPGTVIPMLPPALSDHLCSLRPDVPRLTVTAWLEMDMDGGDVHGVKLEETVIRSRRRFTYEEVQELLEGKSVPRVDGPTKEAVLNMGRLFKALHRMRLRRGALDLDAPEFKVVLGPEGEPVAIEKRARVDSHRLIEEFMLAANEAVARTLHKARAPFPWRIHEDPDPAKLAELQEELGKLGIKAATSLVAHPVKGLQSLLQSAKGHPFEETASIQLVRSLKLARYDANPGGHFGLASKEYCHFTSPIRRYPDLLVHRAVKSLLRGKPRGHAEGLNLEQLCLRCSERERVAQEAERRSVDLARAALYSKRLGESFEAVVVNVTAAGVFLGLPDTGAVGLWRGGHGTLGQRVTAKLVAADTQTGRLEFEPVRGQGMPGGLRVTHEPRGPQKPVFRPKKGPGRGRGRGR